MPWKLVDTFCDTIWRDLAAGWFMRDFINTSAFQPPDSSLKTFVLDLPAASFSVLCSLLSYSSSQCLIFLYEMLRKVFVLRYRCS
jgi:hypothetical protein